MKFFIYKWWEVNLFRCFLKSEINTLLLLFISYKIFLRKNLLFIWYELFFSWEIEDFKKKRKRVRNIHIWKNFPWGDWNETFKKISPKIFLVFFCRVFSLHFLSRLQKKKNKWGQTRNSKLAISENSSKTVFYVNILLFPHHGWAERQFRKLI